MIDTIIKILKKNAIETFCINEKIRESAELYFIRKKLDLSREKAVHEAKVTVYRDFTDQNINYRGSTEVYIYPEMSETEIDKIISEAYASAGYIKNPYFPLPKGVKEICNDNKKIINLMDTALKMAEALYKEDNMSDSFINSSEFYSEKISTRTITSAGCDVSYIKYKTWGEFVVQSTSNNQDVELYRDFEYDEPDVNALREKCREALEIVKDRAYAKKAPDNLDYPIILYGKTVGEFLDFYLQRANASYVYPGYSPFKKGYDAQPDATGERLDITLEPSSPYSFDGVRMMERVLMENGMVKTIHGESSYEYYLEIPVTGSYSKFKCTNGSVKLEEMMKKPHLLIKNFSDFQMDALDGTFGGEIRLAYLYDGKETTIITGGSINGIIFDAQKNFICSEERYKDATYDVPLAIRM